MTPQISVNNYIRLEIDATKSEADFTRSIEGIPAVQDSKATTTVMLRDGETTIIGGLFKVKDAQTVRGVPGLMKIPILGNLFKSRTKSKSKTELLIFITPTIIDSAVYSLEHFKEPESKFNVQNKVTAAKEEESKKQKNTKRSKRRTWHKRSDSL